MSDHAKSPTKLREREAGEPFDGAPSWRITRTLKDGTPVVLRPLGPEDRDDLRRAFEATSPETRYLRFLRDMPGLSDAALTYLTEVDQRTHVAIVAVVTTPDLKTERGVGVARFMLIEGAQGIVEAAITVVDDMQKRGLGTLLVHELERAARVRGVRRIRAEVLADNATMRGILEAAGAHPVAAPSASASTPHASGPAHDAPDDGTVSYDIELQSEPPTTTLGSVLRGAASTMALTLRRFLPPG